MQIYHVLFIHVSVDGYLDCLYFLDIINNVAMNTHVQGFVWANTFIPLSYILGMEMQQLP